MKTDAFWIVAPCNLVDTDWNLKETNCLHHQNDGDVGGKLFWVVIQYLPDYNMHYPIFILIAMRT